MPSLAPVLRAGTPVTKSELPAEVTAFLATYFPADDIVKAEKDHGRRGMEYEVDRNSGVEIDFRDNGEWNDIKAARGNSVPSALVPTAISDYVAANFRNQKIVEISRKRGGYEIELTNGTELKLTADAQPLQSRRHR